jgi:transcriptional regulator with XRE-family HTH domain
MRQSPAMAKRVQTRFKDEKPRHFVRRWREYRNLTQEQLAERVGVTPGTISQLENSRINYRQPLLEALAEALNCNPGDLLNIDPMRDGAIWSIWESLEPAAKTHIIEIAKTFRKAS